MTKLLTELSLIAALLAFPARAAQTNSTITVSWTWPSSGTINSGGLSANDFMTNIWFVLYSSSNVNGTYLPVGAFYHPMYSWTNSYTVTNTSFAATIQATNKLQFLRLTCADASGESDFSNVLPIPPVQPSGNLTGAKGDK